MSTNEPSPPPHRRLLQAVAAVILALGLTAAAAIWALAPDDAEAIDSLQVSQVDTSRKYQLDLQRIGGKSAVAAARVDEWFDSLWHGRRLAGTVAGLAVLAALLCLLVARLPPPDKH